MVGSANSSNSNRLKELAERLGASAYLIDDAQQIRPEWLQGKDNIGVTAGASAPEVLVSGVVTRLQEMTGALVSEAAGEVEKVVFSLPKALQG